ncbi:MAG: translation initiation factor IF-2 N-terminal domain-containing protein, partial [Clostridia bacterium]|nr:translation initiation factor IF-2 N-terminal domain-containing protein [Clostridia bacterium]
MINKYRVHEVAKDFDVPSKEITEILNKYFDGQKKSMTALDENELDVIFESFTQNNSVDSFDAYYAMADEPKPKKEKVTEAEPVKEKEEQSEKTEQPENGDKNKKKEQNNKNDSAKQQPKNNNAAPKKKQKDPNAKPQSRTKGETRTVDTRASNVDLDKYNERYENIAPTNRNIQNDKTVNRQKLKQKSQQYRKGGMRSSRRETEAERLKRIAAERAKKPQLVIKVPDEITVGRLAELLHMTAAEVIKKLFALGQMATVNEVIDYDTAEIVATELGAKCEREIVVTIEERIIDDSDDDDKDLEPRDPVVCVMGHVDHGKTSLLDAIRNTSVTSTEAGGITQHIGAYRVNLNGQYITFLDTPGHAAFTSMRARGAQATDIAVLVVAADDGIMPQTIEAINHAKAAGVSIIVAINKMDKPDVNPDRIMQQLTEHNLVPEEWGGDVICVPVSAKTHMGIDKLLESILLVAEMLELKANPDRAAKG